MRSLRDWVLIHTSIFISLSSLVLIILSFIAPSDGVIVCLVYDTILKMVFLVNLVLEEDKGDEE